MTREQRLRELVERFRKSGGLVISKQQVIYDYCAEELEAILNEESEGNNSDPDVDVIRKLIAAIHFADSKVKSGPCSSSHYVTEFLLPELRYFELEIKAAPTRPADGSEE